MATNEATRFKPKPVEEKLKATNIYLRQDQLSWMQENTDNQSVFIRNAIDAAIRQWQLDNDDTDCAAALDAMAADETEEQPKGRKGRTE